MGGSFQHLRIAARSLFRRPAFTAAAVLTVALGIGANTAVFTLVDGVLLRPLPFEEPEELISIQHLGRDGQDELPVSTGLYLLYRERASSLESLGLWTTTAVNLVSAGDAERVEGQAVTPSFFTTLGLEPAVGRTFVQEEGLPGAEPAVVLSDVLWRTAYGADPGIVGRTVDMSGTLRTVVGVMPPGVGFPDAQARFWIPIVIDEATAPVAMFGTQGVGRTAPGHSLASVETEIEGLLGRLSELRPGDPGAEFLANVGIRSRLRPLKESLVGDVDTTLWILMGTVGFVLLIACANVANLLLVRAESRQRELALRAAVGAGRGDIFRTFLGEGFVLAGAGAALGLVIAAGAVDTVTRLIPASLPRAGEIGVDVRVLGFTAAVAVACTLFFGLFPLVRHRAGDLAAQLREGGARGATGGRDRHRLRHGLIVTQVALALVLLVGSGLMLRSFVALRAVDPGFDREGVLTARIIVPQAEMPEWEETEDFFRQLRERMEAQAGVEAAGYVTRVPLAGSVSFGAITVEDHPRGPDELPIFAALPQAGPGYVEALGLDVVEGRSFRPGDAADGLRAALVSRSFAAQWWPDESPIGRGVRYGGQGEEWYRIVGVVEDVRQYGLDQPAPDMVYFPTLVQAGDGFSPARARDIVLRVGGDPRNAIPLLRRELQALNPRIPLAEARPMTSIFDQATAQTSFTMGVLGAASAIALLLGLVGIYGVVSYVVSQRTREIGVRMALGASAQEVRGMILRQGFLMAGAGVTAGLLAAAALSRVMGSVLFEVSPLDPATYGGVAAVLMLVTLLASWVPAARAASVDPSRALQSK